MAISGSPAPILKLRNRSAFEGVDSPIHVRDSVGHLDEVADIRQLGVEASPHLGRLDIDRAGQLLISHLMPIPDEPHQVTDQQASSSLILPSAMMTSHATHSVNCGC